MVGSVLQGEDALWHVPSIDLSDIFSGSSGKQQPGSLAVKSLPVMHTFRERLDCYGQLCFPIISVMTNGGGDGTRSAFCFPSCSIDGK